MTSQVIKESLRMFPSVPLIGRVTSQDMELDGHVVPMGTEVTVLMYSLHHNANVWPDPEKFDPDRFVITIICKNSFWRFNKIFIKT